MLYRKFGKTNKQVSILGFGCMRLPVINGAFNQIDETKATEMLRYAIDNGVNYIDTAYPYHGKGFDRGGESEPFVGRALKNGYRERVKIATKLPAWLVQSKSDMNRFLDEQLVRLDTDSIDFYLLHALNKTLLANMKQLGANDFLDEAIKDGRIKYAGFSFHDNIDTFIDIVDYYDWSFCQIQYNYLDENYQAGTKGLKYAAGKGMGIAVMEPLKGGGLVNKVPKVVLEKWNNEPIKRKPAEWGLRWVMNHPEVSVVLSGMTTMEQLVENIKTANEGLPDSFNKNDIELVNFAQNTFKERMKVNCTGCRYCMPCPNGVDIPTCFSVYNDAFLFDNLNMAKMQYNMNVSNDAKASVCIECGICEEHCPQGISIREELKKVAATLE